MNEQAFFRKLTRNLDLSKRVEIISSDPNGLGTAKAYAALVWALKQLPDSICCSIFVTHSKEELESRFRFDQSTQADRVLKELADWVVSPKEGVELGQVIESYTAKALDRIRDYSWGRQGEIKSRNVFVFVSSHINQEFLQAGYYDRPDEKNNYYAPRMAVNEKYPDHNIYFLADSSIINRHEEAITTKFHQRIVKNPEIKPNSIVVCQKGGVDFFLVLPPNSNRIDCFSYKGGSYTPAFLSEFCSEEDYLRFWWSIFQDYSFYGLLNEELNKYLILCGLSAYSEVVETKLFDFNIRGRVGDNLHDLSFVELLQEVENHPGSFKLLVERFEEVKRQGKLTEIKHRRDKLESFSNRMVADAVNAFESGKYLSYSDVAVPGVKRDLTYSFVRPAEKETITISFTHLVE